MIISQRFNLNRSILIFRYEFLPISRRKIVFKRTGIKETREIKQIFPKKPLETLNSGCETEVEVRKWMNPDQEEREFVTLWVWHGKRARPVVEIGKDVEELWDAGIAAPVQTSMTNLLSSTRRGWAVGQRPRLPDSSSVPASAGTLPRWKSITLFRSSETLLSANELASEIGRPTNQSRHSTRPRGIDSTFHDDFSIFPILSPCATPFQRSFNVVKSKFPS